MVVRPQQPFLYRAISTVDVIFKHLTNKLKQTFSNRTFTFRQVTGLAFIVE